MTYNSEDMVGMSPLDMMEQDCQWFNERNRVGSLVIFCPHKNKDGILIFRELKKTFTESTAKIIDGIPMVCLADIGNVSIYNVDASSITSSQSPGKFDEKFDHKWCKLLTRKCRYIKYEQQNTFYHPDPFTSNTLLSPSGL